jgi:hypothetical protein
MNVNMFIFFLVILGCMIGLITKMTISDGVPDVNMVIFKRILLITIIFGTINMYSYVESTEFKAIVLILLVLCINVFSVFYSTGKSNYPGSYKFYIILVTSFVIISVSIMMWGATFNNIFGFSFEKDSLAGELQSDILKASQLTYEKDCPAPGKGWEKEYNKLKENDPEKAKICLSLYNRKDMEKGVYT